MSGTVEITLLGSGSSGGVPRVGGDWGVCDPHNPKNRRSRCSIWVEYWGGDVEARPDERTCLLVDTAPDLRDQLLAVNAQYVDALFFTHEHADQTHGIDDLRALAYRMRRRVPTYMDAHTQSHIMAKFGYCFEMPDGRVHPPILEAAPLISTGDRLYIDGPGGALSVDVLGLQHGPTPSLGFIFDDKIAYTPDVHEINTPTLEKLSDIKIWIMDALRYNPHPTHAHVDKAMRWVAQTRTRQAIITNMHIDLDYDTLSAELPSPHLAGYDLMKISA